MIVTAAFGSPSAMSGSDIGLASSATTASWAIAPSISRKGAGRARAASPASGRAVARVRRLTIGRRLLKRAPGVRALNSSRPVGLKRPLSQMRARKGPHAKIKGADARNEKGREDAPVTASRPQIDAEADQIERRDQANAAEQRDGARRAILVRGRN